MASIVNLKINVPLIKSKDGIEGYDSKLLSAWMKRHRMINNWNNFVSGSTGAIIKKNGKAIFLVYRWDVERFMEGGAPLD